jgi:hypothetical protein
MVVRIGVDELNTALVAPIPNAKDSTAVRAKPGRRRNSGSVYRRSGNMFGYK